MSENHEEIPCEYGRFVQVEYRNWEQLRGVVAALLALRRWRALAVHDLLSSEACSLRDLEKRNGFKHVPIGMRFYLYVHYLRRPIVDIIPYPPFEQR